MQPPAAPHAVHSSFYNQLFFKGHVRLANKDHEIALSHRLHSAHLQAIKDSIGTFPAKWDSRDKKWIPPIVDQQSCGSCWDFSGTGTADIAYIVAGVFTNDGSKMFSEQYTLDCGRNGGCGGDDNVTVLKWALDTGLPLTSDYGPYRGRSGSCQFKSSETLYKINKWGFADNSGGSGVTPTDDIKTAIMTYGAVGAAVAADGSFSNYQAGQVFDSTTSESIDHDIILCGWDDSKGSKGAWLLRNSWNTSWGDQGYMWIGYGVNLVGTEAVWAYVNPSAPPIWYP